MFLLDVADRDARLVEPVSFMGASEKLAIACCSIGFGSTSMPYYGTRRLMISSAAAVSLCVSLRGGPGKCRLREADTGVVRIRRLTMP